MEADFWHQKWATNDIAFHHSEANPLLVRHLGALGLPEGSRIFLPLCGKTLDIAWLLARGYRVAGAELSRLAIEQLFAGLGVEADIATTGKVEHWRAPNIDIFVGDLFDLTTAQLSPVDAIYDRAALVALPEAMRSRYTAHLTELTQTAPQLLVSYEYDQQALAGPPFSVSNQEVKRHYGERYDLTLLSSEDLPGGLKGKCPAMENVWMLEKR